MCILVLVHKQTVNNRELSNWKSFGKCLRKAISILILIEMCYKVFQTIENVLLSNIVSEALPHLRIRMHISNANIIFDVLLVTKNIASYSVLNDTSFINHALQ